MELLEVYYDQSGDRYDNSTNTHDDDYSDSSHYTDGGHLDGRSWHWDDDYNKDICNHTDIDNYEDLAW